MNYTKGTKIRFKLVPYGTIQHSIPLTYVLPHSIGLKHYNQNGSAIIGKLNEGTVEEVKDGWIFTTYSDNNGKKLTLGFKPEVLEPLETITNNYELV